MLGPNGRPRVHGAEADPSAPGLHFIGYSNPISGMFREINIDARRIGYAFARDGAARNGGGPLAERARALLAVRLGIPAAA